MDVIFQFFVKTITVTITVIYFIFRVIMVYITISNRVINYSNPIESLIDYTSLR